MVYAFSMTNGLSMLNILRKSTTIFKALATLLVNKYKSLEYLNHLLPLTIFQVNGIKDKLIPITSVNTLTRGILST